MIPSRDPDPVDTGEDAGVRLLWVIDPRKRVVTVYRPPGSRRVLRDDDVIDGEDVLPGFRLAVSDLWP